MAQQTAVEWLLEAIGYKRESDRTTIISIHPDCDVSDLVERAKQMEKEQMIKFAEFVTAYPDKNKNYKGEILHARSKYDETERTVDLLEIYKNK